MAFDRPFIVIGAGGHGGVVVDQLLALGATVLFATDAEPARHGGTLLGVPVAGSDEMIADHEADSVDLALGVGISGADLLRATRWRYDLARSFSAKGYRFPALIHPAATIGRNVTVEDGAQIMAGAVVQANARIGAHAVVNTGASVDHDSIIGDGTHVAPGAVICGKVTCGGGAYIGAGATVVNNIALGDAVFVTAGSAVTKPAVEPGRYSGNPAIRQDLDGSGRRT